MASVFFSYSHLDEGLRDKLEAHLSVLKRQAEITTWHDRRITVGSDFAGAIDAAIETSDVILLLVSSDFLNSGYCQDVEVARALELNADGKATVIPVILRACDWQNSPLGGLLAAPRDGKPIVSWTDLDEAFLDVVQKIRAALPKVSASLAGTRAASAAVAPSFSPSPSGPRSSNLRVAKSFTEADRDRFLVEAFDFMAKFFENSIAEISQRNDGIDGTFRRIDANAFTGVIYQHGKSVARCTIRIGSSFGRGITYSATDRGSDNSFNESMSVEDDAEGLFLKTMGMSSLGNDKEAHLTFEGAAECYWDLFIRPLQER